MKKLWLAGLVFAMTTAAAEIHASKPEPGVGLTIYNDNFAVVKERRLLDLSHGLNTLKFTDVASLIDPTSVHFECLSAPEGTYSILEQNYEFDLVNTESLLQRYIDKPVVLRVKGSGADISTDMSGILSASIGYDLILRNPDDGTMQIINRNSVEYIGLDSMPDDLVTKPTLVWLVNGKKSGSQLCQTTYTTDGISWKADYNAVLNETDDAVDLTGWVTIDNKSGAAYKEAKIKLIAGDVRRIQPKRANARYKYDMERVGNAIPLQEDFGFEEKPFMEYHLYTLGRKSTINNKQVKQIELIEPAENVPAEKVFVYEWQKKPKKVQVKIEFENKKENHLGIALPKGKVRVFKRDQTDGMLEFVGEDEIDHTAKKEKLSLYIGDAFDIVPEHTILDTKHSRRTRTEKHQVKLRNRKDEEISVLVDHMLFDYANWTVDQSTHSYEKRDSHTIRFPVAVPADSEVVLEFTVTTKWEM